MEVYCLLAADVVAHFNLKKFKYLQNMKLNYYTLVLILSLFFISCEKNEDDLIIENPLVGFSISTGELVPSFNPLITVYEVTSLNTLNEITINISTKGNIPVYLNEMLVEGTVNSLKLENGDNIIIRTLDNESNPIEYIVSYLPEDIPRANVVTNNNPSDGYIFVNYYEFSLATGFKDHTYIAILNNDGFPVYYKKVPYRRVGNFTYHNIGNNEKRFSYGINNGNTIVMDENFNVIQSLSLLPYNSHNGYPSDNHDFIYLNDDHYIIPAYVNRENVDMTAYGGWGSVELIDFVFQEIKNGQVIFEWNSADHPEVFNSVSDVFRNQFNGAGPVDYFHFNSFNIDPRDSHFLVSARHTDQVYKIHRTTGEIIWRSGGTTSDYTLKSEERFSHQHHANISKDGTLLLFDNNVNLDQKTRFVEYSIDQNNYTLDIVKEYHKDGLFMNIMGSIQKLNNDNFFIGWGGNTSSQINAARADITEIDNQGNILLDISFTNNLEKFTNTYRALKYNINF